MLRRRQDCRDLVKSKNWQTLLEMADLFLQSYECPPPLNATLLCGYITASIIKDGTAQLLRYIEIEAEMAPKPGETE